MSARVRLRSRTTAMTLDPLTTTHVNSSVTCANAARVGLCLVA
jgi:hypothetical protein